VAYSNLLLWELKYNTLRLRSRLDQPLVDHPAEIKEERKREERFSVFSNTLRKR
jgi:hypothetical protein